MIFLYLPSQSLEALVINLIRSLILSHSSVYLFNVSLLLLVETSVKYLFPLLSSMYPSTLSIIKIYFINNKVQRIYAINFYIAKIFDSNIPNVINNDIFIWLFIYLNSIWTNIFNINHVSKKQYVQFLILISLIRLIYVFNIVLSILFKSIFCVIIITTDRNNRTKY